CFFFFQAEDGIRDFHVTGVQTCALPISRPVGPEEYQPISRRVAEWLGINQFDKTTFEPHRLMYWPSCPRDVEPVFEYSDGPWLRSEERRVGKGGRRRGGGWGA